MKMGFDPRAVTNMLLDFADAANIEVTNLALNKILFFCHSDSIIEQQSPLINLTFEAWKFGPVLPIIYHQFKKHGYDHITTRATKLCRDTGNNIIAEYSEFEEFVPFLRTYFTRYATLSPASLVNLSHAPGTPWDIVWNSSDTENYGMKISDDLIREIISNPINPDKRKNTHVH